MRKQNLHFYYGDPYVHPADVAHRDGAGLLMPHSNAFRAVLCQHHECAGMA